MTAVAFPFVDVTIDTTGLTPTARRSPGVVAVVGASDQGAAPANVPQPISSASTAASAFAGVDDDGDFVSTPLYRSLTLALAQNPRPSKVYGVKVAGNDYAAALRALEAADDVTFVALAEVTTVGNPDPPTHLRALLAHCEQMSQQGQRRIAVAMIDPSLPKAATHSEYVTEAVESVSALGSDAGRMVMVAARGVDGDAATAAMSAIAGHAPHVSPVLKQVRGISIPLESQYAPEEITSLSAAGVIPIIDPTLIVGDSLHLAEGRCFGASADLGYVDTVRVLDDIEFRLRAGLISSVGSARITLAGLTRIVTRISGILGVLVRAGVITKYSVTIPVLEILRAPQSTWTSTDANLVRTARENREVDVYVSVTYGPAVHRLKITLHPRFL